MLDRGRSEALQMSADPVLQADMFQALGTSYVKLGDGENAEPLLRRAKQVICSHERSNQCADIEFELGMAIRTHGSPQESLGLVPDAVLIKQTVLNCSHTSFSTP